MGFGGIGGGTLVVVDVFSVAEVFVVTFLSSFVGSSLAGCLSLSSLLQGEDTRVVFCLTSGGMTSALLSPMRISLR